MSRQDADTDEQEGHQVDTQCRLQSDIDKDAEIQQDEEVQIAPGAYLVFIAGNETVCRADDEQNKEIPEGGEFPRLIVEPDGSEGHQLAEGLAEEFHLPVVEGVSQQQPVGYAPSYQGSEETFGLERLEVVGAYPEDGDKQHELRKKQAAQSDEDKGVEETACGPCLLVAPEKEKQCHQEGGGCQVSRIQHVQAGADGYQQEVDRSLYRCPHPDDGERIVELYQEIPDDGIQQKAEETVCPGGDAEVTECFPKGISALLCLRFGQQNGSQYPAGY